eukprot:CAMPEP_0118951462 /NCGR_PEP_ID=MMETSP1169-20130426/53177_1 /TAXON_ID=36882 /ORGANISM="Pyramimonas obovata, Strain CCMP722" /LENGTH=183 /DNA_ID=CAMNT_0006898529 /DNA_START=21 /DNA_END=568 /DNA_ORIENTATION=+
MEVRSGLFLGGRAEAEGARSGGGFTHLLSVGCPLEGGASDNVEHLSFPDILDEEEANILEILEQSVKFIDDALSEDAGRRVLVHCEAGRSRSAAVVCAWLMSKDGVCFEDALSSLQKVVPAAGPNEGFCEQLRLFGSMGCKVDPTRPAYRHFKAQQIALKRQNEGWLDASILTALPGTTGEGG